MFWFHGYLLQAKFYSCVLANGAGAFGWSCPHLCSAGGFSSPRHCLPSDTKRDKMIIFYCLDEPQNRTREREKNCNLRKIFAALLWLQITYRLLEQIKTFIILNLWFRSCNIKTLFYRAEETGKKLWRGMVHPDAFLSEDERRSQGWKESKAKQNSQENVDHRMLWSQRKPIFFLFSCGSLHNLL